MKTKIQKWVGLVKLGYNSIRLIRNPALLDDVITLSENLANDELFKQIETHLRSQSAHGAWALEHRPRIGKVDIEGLSKLPDGTLGKSYADFLIANKLDPNALPTRVATNPQEYILAHLYETHDLWHVLTGFKPDVAGELGLQAYYASQIPSALALLILAIGHLNTIFFAFADRDARMQAIAEGWMMGRQSQPLFGMNWNLMWDRPIDEIRTSLNLKVASNVLPVPVSNQRLGLALAN